MFGEVVKVRLQRVDLRASFVMIELLPQPSWVPAELSRLQSQMQVRQESHAALTYTVCVE